MAKSGFKGVPGDSGKSDLPALNTRKEQAKAPEELKGSNFDNPQNKLSPKYLPKSI